jgi:hypothetical protein
MIFMANRLFKIVGLAALVAFPAHSQTLSALDRAVVITTSLQFITEDDIDQRTKLNLLLAQKQVRREDVINELVIDVERIAEACRFTVGCFGRQSPRGHVLAVKRRAGGSDEITGGEGYPARHSEKTPWL